MPKPADRPVEHAAEAAPLTQRRRNWLTFSLRSLMILVTLCCLAVGGKLKYDWHRKKGLVAEWVAPLAKEARNPTHTVDLKRTIPNPQDAPGKVNAKDEVDLLKFGILELDTSEERFAALKILVNSRQLESLPILRGLISKSRHPEMQAMLLHLVSLAQDPNDIPRIAEFLKSQNAGLRGAAAESIGFIHEPTYGFPIDWGGASHVFLNTAPAIDASRLFNEGGGQFVNAAEEQVRQKKIPPGTREPLERMMLHGPTQEERTAAARALVAWPPTEYKLRLAEWGVWIDGHGKLEIAKSVLDEIPPFVHRTGNPLASIARNRFDGIIVITKPIIHLTADRPLAVDLEVAIAKGRPWYAFPRPDSFTMHTDHLDATQTWAQQVETELKVLDPQGFPLLAPMSEGYPWIHPQVRSAGAGAAAYGGPSAGISAVGLRWQSLIVSPKRESWMVLPDVTGEKQFSWWKELRDVPSSWVVNQGETERFLYYDGPTLAESPVRPVLESTALILITENMFRNFAYHQSLRELLPPEIETSDRDCLFIDAKSNPPKAVGFRLSAAPHRKETIDLADQMWLEGDEMESALLTILLRRGLTNEEAEGLLASWRVRFFQAPGNRLVTFLTDAEYDRMCPLQIRPETTKEVRVGIVLTEL